MGRNSKCYCATRILGRIDYVLSYLNNGFELDEELLDELYPHYWCRELNCPTCYFDVSKTGGGDWQGCDLREPCDFVDKISQACNDNNMFQLIIYLTLFKSHLEEIIQ